PGGRAAVRRRLDTGVRRQGGRGISNLLPGVTDRPENRGPALFGRPPAGLCTRLLFAARAATAVVLVSTAASASLAGDLERGRQRAEMLCQTCHGLDGQATLPGAPNLSGQNRDYLVIQLEAYRDGSRTHPQMSIVAGSLSDEDIEDVAEWYSSIRVTLELP